MSWLVFCFTITILINNVSPFGPYTLIPGDTTWTDTIDNTDPNYQQTYTDALTGDGDYWFYPEYRSDRANDQGGLAGVTGTVPGTSEPIWGWWNFYKQYLDTSWTEDPDRAMVRYFTCGSYGTVDISFNFWMCNEGYTPGGGRPNGMSSNTVVTMKRTSLTQGQNILYRRYDHSCWSDYSSNPANNPYGYNPSGVDCTNQVRRCQVSESFDTGGINYGASGDTIVLKVTWESNAQGDGNSWHTAGMNDLTITCNRTPTKAPTISPTVTTATPTKIPSVTPTKSPTKSPTVTTATPTKSPTKSPSVTTATPTKIPSATPTKSPTPAPTGNPTRNPTTHFPTGSPNTAMPSKYPSKIPTNDPTQTPTIDPTNNPTEVAGEFEPCIDEFILFSDKNKIKISIEISRKTKEMNMILEGPNDRWFGIGFGGNTMKDTYVITVNEAIQERKLGDHKRGTDITNTFNSVENIPLLTKHIVSLIRDYKINNNVNAFDFTDFFNCNIAELNVIWAIGEELTFGHHFEQISSSFFSCACNETILSTVYVEPTVKPTAKPTENILGNESWCLTCMYSVIIGIITTMLFL